MSDASPRNREKKSSRSRATGGRAAADSVPRSKKDAKASRRPLRSESPAESASASSGEDGRETKKRPSKKDRPRDRSRSRSRSRGHGSRHRRSRSRGEKRRRSRSRSRSRGHSVRRSRKGRDSRARRGEEEEEEVDEPDIASDEEEERIRRLDKKDVRAGKFSRKSRSFMDDQAGAIDDDEDDDEDEDEYEATDAEDESESVDSSSSGSQDATHRRRASREADREARRLNDALEAKHAAMKARKAAKEVRRDRPAAAATAAGSTSGARAGDTGNAGAPQRRRVTKPSSEDEAGTDEGGAGPGVSTAPPPTATATKVATKVASSERPSRIDAAATSRPVAAVTTRDGVLLHKHTEPAKPLSSASSTVPSKPAEVAPGALKQIVTPSNATRTAPTVMPPAPAAKLAVAAAASAAAAVAPKATVPPKPAVAIAAPAPAAAPVLAPVEPDEPEGMEVTDEDTVTSGARGAAAVADEVPDEEECPVPRDEPEKPPAKKKHGSTSDRKHASDQVARGASGGGDDGGDRARDKTKAKTKSKDKAAPAKEKAAKKQKKGGAKEREDGATGDGDDGPVQGLSATAARKQELADAAVAFYEHPLIKIMGNTAVPTDFKVASVLKGKARLVLNLHRIGLGARMATLGRILSVGHAYKLPSTMAEWGIDHFKVMCGGLVLIGPQGAQSSNTDTDAPAASFTQQSPAKTYWEAISGFDDKVAPDTRLKAMRELWLHVMSACAAPDTEQVDPPARFIAYSTATNSRRKVPDAMYPAEARVMRRTTAVFAGFPGSPFSFPSHKDVLVTSGDMPNREWTIGWAQGSRTAPFFSQSVMAWGVCLQGRPWVVNVPDVLTAADANDCMVTCISPGSIRVIPDSMLAHLVIGRAARITVRHHCDCGGCYFEVHSKFAQTFVECNKDEKKLFRQAKQAMQAHEEQCAAIASRFATAERKAEKAWGVGGDLAVCFRAEDLSAERVAAGSTACEVDEGDGGPWSIEAHVRRVASKVAGDAVDTKHKMGDAPATGPPLSEVRAPKVDEREHKGDAPVAGKRKSEGPTKLPKPAAPAVPSQQVASAVAADEDVPSGESAKKSRRTATPPARPASPARHHQQQQQQQQPRTQDSASKQATQDRNDETKGHSVPSAPVSQQRRAKRVVSSEAGSDDEGEAAESEAHATMEVEVTEEPVVATKCAESTAPSVPPAQVQQPEPPQMVSAQMALCMDELGALADALSAAVPPTSREATPTVAPASATTPAQESIADQGAEEHHVPPADVPPPAAAAAAAAAGACVTGDIFSIMARESEDDAEAVAEADEQAAAEADAEAEAGADTDGHAEMNRLVDEEVAQLDDLSFLPDASMLGLCGDACVAHAVSDGGSKKCPAMKIAAKSFTESMTKVAPFRDAEGGGKRVVRVKMACKDGWHTFYGCELNGPVTENPDDRARMLVFCDAPFEAGHGAPSGNGTRVYVIHNNRKFDTSCTRFISVCKLTSELKAGTATLIAHIADRPRPVSVA